MTDLDPMPWKRRRAARVARPPRPLPRWWPNWLPAWPLRFGRLGVGVGLVGVVAGWLLMETISGVVFEPPLGQRLCRWGPVTGFCSALGLGNLPTEEQKRDLATAQAVGTRQALNAFRDKHKDSPLDSEAERALARCHDVMVAVRVTQRHDLLVTQPLAAASQAEAGAETLANRAAERLCRGYEASNAFRMIGSQAERRSLDCVSLDSRRICTWTGEAVCSLDELRPDERCEPPTRE